MANKFCFRATRGKFKGDIENLRALDFNGQTVNFTVGLKVTGATSTANGILVSQTDAGATGTLILRDVKGVFVNGETLSDSGGGNGAAVNSDYCPLLTPSDQVIVQIDGTSMNRSEAVQLLELIEQRLITDAFPQRGL